MAANAGPITRATLNPLELSAIASTTSSLPTSSIINAWRAGMSNALIDPATSDNNANHATVMCPDQSNHHRIAACTPNNACVSLTKRSFGWRSTTTPAYNVSSSTGSDPAADTTPTMNALFV